MEPHRADAALTAACTPAWTGGACALGGIEDVYGLPEQHALVTAQNHQLFARLLERRLED